MIAVRTVIDGTQDTLKSNSGQAPNWLVGDHLGSTSLVTDSAGAVVSEVRYSAFGEMRFLNGETVTDLLYTGQKLEEEIGLYYYGARWYDSALGRFVQADIIVPDAGSSSSYDRYAYVENNPLKYTDPSGHRKVVGGPNGVTIEYEDGSGGLTMSGYVFILSCGLYTSCTSNPPQAEADYNNQVPFQPLKESIEYKGGTVIYAGTHAVQGEKLLYRDEVKAIIEENQNAKGIFLVGHSYGTGANTLAAYELMSPEGNTYNLDGIVTLDSYLITGDGGAEYGAYDTQDKADYVLNLIPNYTAHSLDHEAALNWETDFPREGMGPGPALSDTHTILANSAEMTEKVFRFLLYQVMRNK